MKLRLERSHDLMAVRLVNAFLLRTVRRIGRHPRFRALESTTCKWFLVLFAAVLITHVICVVVR